MNHQAEIDNIVTILKEKDSFLLITHKDPDADGVGSMLALGRALTNADKEVVLLSEKPVPPPIKHLSGSEAIVQEVDPNKVFDAVIILDCGDAQRVGAPQESLKDRRPTINIDHHEVHDFFGDLNLVDPKSSSTGELVYGLIIKAGFLIDVNVAENILAAIQADTGSFRYDNTTSQSLKIAGEMMDYGADPHQIFLKMMNETSRSRMRLLEMALGSVEFYYNGRVGMVTLSSEMFEKAEACWEDSEKFVDYLRYVSGVELAVLIREAGNKRYKFSMRSNHNINVATLANRFGGGGHAKAAGFECHESIDVFKESFLKETGKLLGVLSN